MLLSHTVSLAPMLKLPMFCRGELGTRTSENQLIKSSYHLLKRCVLDDTAQHADHEGKASCESLSGCLIAS